MYSERYTPFQKSVTRWHSFQEPSSSANWMPIAGYGRFHSPENHGLLPPSSCPSVATGSIRCPLGYQVHRSTSKRECRKFGSDTKEHNERLTAALKKIETAGVILNPSKCLHLSLPTLSLPILILPTYVRCHPILSNPICQIPFCLTKSSHAPFENTESEWLMYNLTKMTPNY